MDCYFNFVYNEKYDCVFLCIVHRFVFVYKLNLKTFSSERSVIFGAIDFVNE